MRYPHVQVQLSGQDGNAYGIIGRVSMALKRAGLEPEVIDEFKEQATSGDYDHLQRVCMEWVDVL